ncbi:inositol monophosphatase [Geothrix limicola]|uniref:Inositol-1-monophosphatase n=1 Tax=Geothrix limicola TaxID=2927978 RepID=A0ABQ5QGT7_9BACT|nr:inositol monophosphatase family protein [Geothrix limicola]GLH74079.1 inositol monophosphatase [Geothrix limicola]
MFDAQRDACVAAAEAGGKVLLGYFRKLEPGMINEKTKNDFVSDADRASEAAIRAELEFRFPQYGFLGEESGSSGSAEIRWIVDPLDGTLNFVQGFPHWCVSVALWDAEGPVAGCVLDPLRGDCFVAVRGMGATWNGKPMRVSQQGGLDGAYLATGFAYQLGDRWPKFNEALGRVFPRAMGIRRAGSAALDLAHTACGIFDGYFELGLQPWDMAAGVLLLQEAGGCITDWEGGQTWFNTGSVVTGTRGVVQDLLGCTKEHGAS